MLIYCLLGGTRKYVDKVFITVGSILYTASKGLAVWVRILNPKTKRKFEWNVLF